MDPLNTQNINTQTPPQMMPSHDRKIGPIVGAVIIIILLVLAALYFWSIKLNSKAEIPAVQTTQTDGSAMKMDDGTIMTNDNQTSITTPTPAPTPAEAKIDMDLGLDGLNDINTKTDF